MWRTAWATLRANWTRLVLTFTTVLLGASFVAGAMVVSSSLSEGQEALREDLSVLVTPTDRGVGEGEGKLSQGGQSGALLDQEQLARMADLPGVAEVNGVVEGYAAVAGAGGEVMVTAGFEVRMTGSNWTGTDRMSLAGGRAPAGETEVAVAENVASDGGISLGDTITVLHRDGRSEAEVVGLYDYRPTGREAGAAPAVAFDQTTAQRLLLGAGEFTGAEITAEPGAGTEQVRAEVSRVLPAGFAAVGRDQLAEDLRLATEQTSGALSSTVLAFTGIALVVGITLIINTFSMLVARRGRELALLRAVGATRRQIRRSVLLEAAVVGVLGSATGLAIGIGLAVPVVGYAAGADPTLTGNVVISASAVVVTLLVGTGTTLLAAWLPARRAATVSPVAALGGEQPGEAKGSAWLRRIGVVLAAFSVLLLVIAAIGDSFPTRAFGMLGALGLLLSAIVCARSLSGPLINLLGRPLRRTALGGMAVRNTMRSPRRTAATATALAIGVSVATGITIFGTTISSISERDLGAGLAGETVVANIAGGQISSETWQRVRELPSVAEASTLRTERITLDGTEIVAGTTETSAIGRTVNLELSSGSLADLALGIFVQDSIAAQHDWTLGQQVELRSVRGGGQPVRITGTFAEAPMFGQVVLAPALADAHFRPGNGNPLVVAAKPGTGQAAVEQSLREAVAGRSDLAVMTSTDYVRSRITEVDFYLGAVTGLLGLSVLIAFLGIINTLSLSVLERGREIGLLRAIGMTRRQIRGLIRTESMLIALLGGVIGLATGIVLGAMMQNFILSRGVFDLVVPLPSIALAVVGISLGGVLAALWPAYRAARTNVIRAAAAE